MCEEALEKVEEFRKHISSCQECQSLILLQKDAVALSMLSMSDEEIIKRMSKGKGQDGID